MLIKCKECELPVSDKALACPHCGNPLKEVVAPKYNSKKRRRLPNGFGRITEIKDQNLRDRFRVMVTVGTDELGRPIGRLLKPKAYFHTYNEAYEALAEYNKSPYDLEDDLTMSQLYDKWLEYYSKSVHSESYLRTIACSWAYCSSVYNMRVKDLRARHIKWCMDLGAIEYNGEKKHASPAIKSRIKSTFNLMLDYALEFELVDRNYARTFNLSDDVKEDMEQMKRDHLSFSDAEMNCLWENVKKVAYVNIILFQCYSGFRPQELGLIRLENVDLNQNIIVGGMKTKAGTNRIVPIHPRVKPIVEELVQNAQKYNSEYLIYCDDATTHTTNTKFTYDKYNYRFKCAMEHLKMNPDHRPHDPRKQFITMAKKYNCDEYAIKRIVGHKILDLTESVYTDRDSNWLYNEICKIQ